MGPYSNSRNNFDADYWDHSDRSNSEGSGYRFDYSEVDAQGTAEGENLLLRTQLQSRPHQHLHGHLLSQHKIRNTLLVLMWVAVVTLLGSHLAGELWTQQGAISTTTEKTTTTTTNYSSVVGDAPNSTTTSSSRVDDDNNNNNNNSSIVSTEGPEEVKIAVAPTAGPTAESTTAAHALGPTTSPTAATRAAAAPTAVTTNPATTPPTSTQHAATAATTAATATLKDKDKHNAREKEDEEGWFDPVLFVSGQVVYENEQYRRVCAHVYNSVLCLTVRYPFRVAPQDPTVNYTKPITADFYTLPAGNLIWVDTAALQACNATLIQHQLETGDDSNTMVHREIHTCIEQVASTTRGAVVGLWTKTANRGTGKTVLFGVMDDNSQQRMFDYYKGQTVLIFGASPTPVITKNMAPAFGKCQSVHLGFLCRGEHSQRRRELLRQPLLLLQQQQQPQQERQLRLLPAWTRDPNVVSLNWIWFTPVDARWMKNHWVEANTSVAWWLDSVRMDAEFPFPTNVTIIIEHPMAHMQNQNMMETNWSQIEDIQEKWPPVFLDVVNEGSSLKTLVQKEWGIHISKVIAFDGMPQFFPTESSAYDFRIHDSKTQQEFIDRKGYDGWIPDYGTTCRGPIPRGSNFTIVNELARASYKRQGMDMKWYGEIYEFTNLFWYAVEGWTDKGLDCTHGLAGHIHKYFWSAMVEDAVQEQQQQGDRSIGHS